MSRSGGADPDGNQPGNLYIVIKVCSMQQYSMELEFLKLESSPNSSSKNRLTYKIVLLVCCFPKIFLKSCYLANLPLTGYVVLKVCLMFVYD